jgi:hypothetical protein
MEESILLADVMQQLKISHQMHQPWSSEHGAMRPHDLARLKTLEQVNAG